ncbi:hypothetical protein [Streptomyces sp. NPDC060001]|uniref:hypothetical protein n=1 Tax=Streptomyces sp. NPDC060001 TaxID=3347032 RepID=UPI0036A503E9
MKRETYKGRKIKVVAGRGNGFGRTRVTLNGVELGSWMGDEDKTLRSIRGSIDHADEVGVSSARYGAEWYAPGTYELCDEGHAKEIGGECGHSWCVEQRAKLAPVVETSEAESERLAYDMARLRRIHPSERTEAQREELRVANARLVELCSVPPEGYSTPKAAADLMAFAESHGWRTSAVWTALGYEGEPFLTVQVGHLVGDESREQYRGDRWVYSLTWHSRDCAPGKTRRFGQGTAQTPDKPATHGAPSVKAIRDVIAANPAAVSDAA